jgi:hypothetical protein
VFIRNDTTWTQQQKLYPSDPTPWARFGWSVSLYGDTALIGAPEDNYNGFAPGSVYVFIRNGATWTQQTKLLALDGAVWDYFGGSVSLKGDTALIGAQCDDGCKGSAYVFTRTRTTWTQQAKLLASDGADNDDFGVSVSLDGDTGLIGASNDDQKGSAYVFTRIGTTWSQQAKLIASDGAHQEYFGNDVSLDGNTALIGAEGSGSAYVFIRNGTTWTQQQKLLPWDGDGGFGISVSLDKGTAFIGAISCDQGRGSVYVFKKESENQKPPIPPIITGPAKGIITVYTAYNFTTIDPENDMVYYFIDWGDYTNSGWIGLYPSGDEIKQSHTWSKKGTYTIKAKAKDIYENESDWGTLTITMPCSYNMPFVSFWERLFERFPHAFPILRYLMEY